MFTVGDVKLPIGPTGRHIVVLRPGSVKSHISALKDVAGISVASTADVDDGVVSEAKLGNAKGLHFEYLDLAVVEGNQDQISALNQAVEDESNPVLSIEPEMYVIPFGCCSETEGDDISGFLTPLGIGYMQGYVQAVQSVAAQLLNKTTAAAGGADVGVAATYTDTPTLTWGLQATGVATSRCSGSGIRVAVLDTGLDLHHPDFAGRSIVTASFVPGVSTVQDGHGHGTHCIGTSCGPLTPPAGGTSRRYGIAYGATILVGKVLSDAGSGQTGWILGGINWAIQNKATIISMSLGSPVAAGQPYSPAYEQAALAALNNNCLIVAAAGNSGQNPQYYPVGSPANCPSVFAVAALDNNLQRAAFSCIGVNPNGGEVNIAAPGVNVFSSYKLSGRYTMMSGTSMATPHVAGCAALWAQWTGLRGKALWQRLESTARNVGLPPQQAGAGLVQAPSCLRIPFRPPLPFPLPHIPPIGPDPGPIAPIIR